MAKIYNYDVMFDDTSIDVSKEVALVWSITYSILHPRNCSAYFPALVLRV